MDDVGFGANLVKFDWVGYYYYYYYYYFGGVDTTTRFVHSWWRFYPFVPNAVWWCKCQPSPAVRPHQSTQLTQPTRPSPPVHKTIKFDPVFRNTSINLARSFFLPFLFFPTQVRARRGARRQAAVVGERRQDHPGVEPRWWPGAQRAPGSPGRGARVGGVAAGPAGLRELGPHHSCLERCGRGKQKTSTSRSS